MSTRAACDSEVVDHISDRRRTLTDDLKKITILEKKRDSGGDLTPAELELIASKDGFTESLAELENFLAFYKLNVPPVLTLSEEVMESVTTGLTILQEACKKLSTSVDRLNASIADTTECFHLLKDFMD